MAQIDAVLNLAIQARASDAHIATGSSFVFRQFGKLKRIKSQEVTPKLSKTLIYEILTETQRAQLEKDLQIDFSYEIEGKARFRGNAIVQRKGP